MSRSFVVIAAVAISTSCSPAGPSVVSDSSVPDTSAVTASIVEQFQSIGLEAQIEPTLGGSFNVTERTVRIPSVGDSVFLHVFRTDELAADEASRITPDGQVRPPEGPTHQIVDYIVRQSFYHAERVVARHSGCDARVANAMERLFGPPVVVTLHICR
jgi:hypothetical protein